MTYKISMDFAYNVGGALVNLKSIIESCGVPNNYIEIGVFEGQTTFWLADNVCPINSHLKMYCIDPHVGSNDMGDDFVMVKDNFLYNLQECKYRDQIEYIEKYSFDGLTDLIHRGVKAQLIYIDGDHKATAVIEDLVLAWRLLDVGGVILCDDVTNWRHKEKNGFSAAHMSPRIAVESFIQCNWNHISTLNIPNSTQTAFMKVSE